MSISYLKSLGLFFFLIIGCFPNLEAQSNYKIVESGATDMKLSGTSTLHDWEMNSKSCTGNALFKFELVKKENLISLKSLTFSLVVEDLKSEEKTLDNNAYKALKTDEYKDITYTLISAKIVSRKNQEYLLKTRGSLIIAGVTKIISMNVTCTVNKDSTITCTGFKTLKMTDYNVKPPTFMLGAMKTGDTIKLDFILVYTNVDALKNI